MDYVSDSIFNKICPVCGKKYSEEDNFCSKHTKLVKLIYIDELVKICPKCNKKYTKDDNFCGEHDEAIELCYIKDLVKECPGCGAQYPEDYNYCIKCEWDEKLITIGQTPPKRNYDVRDIHINPNHYYDFRKHVNCYSDLDELLSDGNIKSLKEFDLSENQFNQIINDIIAAYRAVMHNFIERYDIDFDGLYTIDKIFLLSKSFVKTEYKAGGVDLGHYTVNEIYIDERQEIAYQITTIIHELSHFLFSEIFEQIISLLLDTDKTDILEALVCYILENDEMNYLIDEYCANTVENRFVAIEYQNYRSYKQILKEFLRNHDVDYVVIAESIGNTFAEYIISIIESFVDEILREEIKIEFSNLANQKGYDGLGHEIDDNLDWDEFKKACRLILTKNLDNILNNADEQEMILEYSENFKRINN